jgi:hypothetical protein
MTAKDTPVKHREFVIIESPYSGNLQENLQYLKRCLRDSWERGEHPLASHGYYPMFLNESDPKERQAGIEAGYQLWPLASKIIFYSDYGMSKGMEAALDRAVHHRLEVVTRSIGPNG